MTNEKAVIQKLLKIAESQQKIITKLAQGYQAPAQKVEPKLPPHGSESNAVLTALPEAVRLMVNRLEVHPGLGMGQPGDVKVQFKPGKSSSDAFATVQKTVEQLQNSNVLPLKNYKVEEIV